MSDKTMTVGVVLWIAGMVIVVAASPQIAAGLAMVMLGYVLVGGPRG